MLTYRITKILFVSLLAVLETFYPESLFAQKTTKENIETLQQNLEKRDTNEVCKLMRNFLSRNREYFVEYTDPTEKAQITIITSDRRRYTEESPFRFEIPLGPVRIDSLMVKLQSGVTRACQFLDNWQVREFTHIKLKVGVHPVLLLNVDSIFCSRSRSGGVLDKPIIPFPHKKLSILTISIGTVASGTYCWFRKEKGNAKDRYDDYQKATTIQQAIELRGTVKNSRTRRDIAAVISITSSATFAFLFVRDLFLRGDQTETWSSIPDALDAQRKFHFSLEPSTSEKGIKISMTVKL
jgi:hypothetical protein